MRVSPPIAVIGLMVVVVAAGVWIAPQQQKAEQITVTLPTATHQKLAHWGQNHPGANGRPLTVVQVMGANYLSNRFYSVHPRRNDRFLRASTVMQAIFNDVDFSDFTFTRHMLGALYELSPEALAG